MTTKIFKKTAALILLTSTSFGLWTAPGISIPKDFDDVPVPHEEPETEPPIPQQPQAPQKEVRIPTALLASLVESAAGSTQIKLDNYGPRRDNTWLENKSRIKLPTILGGREYRFNIPEYVKDLDCGLLCPDLGDAKFYANDVNLDGLQVEWQQSAFKLSLTFESGDREIKGHNTGRANIVPDVEMNNTRLDVYLQPIARNGQLSYRVSQTDFDADIQATGGCNIPKLDICNWAFGYKDKITSQIKDQVVSRLNDDDLQDRVATLLKPELQKRGIQSVTTVRASGSELIIETPTNVGQVAPPLRPVFSH